MPPSVFLAAFISRSTSASVRYSRVRRVPLGGPLGSNCSIYSSWRDQPEVPFGHVLRAARVDDCPDNDRSRNSRQGAIHRHMGPPFRFYCLETPPPPALATSV